MSEKRLLFFVVIIAFVFRLIIILQTKVTFFSDDAIYVSLARFFYEGNFTKAFHPTWPPLFPFTSALIFNLIQNWESSLQLVSAISSSLLIIPIYFIFKLYFGRYYSIIISIFIVSTVPFMWASVYPLSDMLALLLIISTLSALLWGIYHKKPKYLLLSSLFSALLYLTRTEGTMFFGLTFIYLFFYMVFTRSRFIWLILFVLVFFAVISPYVMAMRFQFGSWSLSQKFSATVQQSHSFQLRNGTTWSQEVVSIKNPNYTSKYFRGGTDFLLENSDWFIWWFGEKLGKWNNAYFLTTPLWFWLLCLIGTLKIFQKKHFWAISYLIYVMAIGIIATIFTTPLVELRYLQWTVPIFILFFTLGLQLILTRVKKTNFSLPLALILLASLPTSNLGHSLNPFAFAEDVTRTMNWEEIKTAANWINQNKKTPNPKIMMRHEGIEFYSNGESIYTPQLSYEKVLEYAKSHQVDYFVAWEKEIPGDPELSFLLDVTKPHPGLNEVYRSSQGPLIRIFTL